MTLHQERSSAELESRIEHGSVLKASMSVSPYDKVVAAHAYFKRVLASKHGLALIDQAVVSGTSFLTTVMIARAASADVLGVYAMALSLLIMAVSIQDSLITLPFTIFRQNSIVSPEEHAGSSLILSGLLSVAALLAFIVAAAGLSIAGAPEGLVAAVGVLA